MSIFSRRKIEIDPEDHELVAMMSAQNSETTLFQTETINITKISQDLNNENQIERTRKRDYRPSRMSDSFMTATFKPKQEEKNEQSAVLAEYRRIQEELEELEQIRPLDADFQFEKQVDIDPEVTAPSKQRKRNVTSEIDPQELDEYMIKTKKVNRLMVSLIIAAIVIVAAIVIIILIFNLRRSGQASPLGGV